MATLQEAQAIVAGHMEAIADVFQPGAKVTVLVRNPVGEKTPGTQDFLMTADTLDEAAGVIARRSAGSGMATAWIDMAAPSTLRDQGLTVDIVDGRLQISIGVDALMVAVKAGPVWEDNVGEERGWSITSADGFAGDIVCALRDEEEDGTTLVHVALDAAIERAIDAGSLNVDLGEDA